MIEQFGKGEKERYIKWVKDNPGGFVWISGHGKLHQAPCGPDMFTKKKAPSTVGASDLGEVASQGAPKQAVPRIWGSKKDELLDWLREHGKKVRAYCKKCLDGPPSPPGEQEPNPSYATQPRSRTPPPDPLITDILEMLGKCSPKFFEHLVVKVLRAMGYGWGDDAWRVTGNPGDEGIDAVIYQDRLGMDVICVQAKRWQGTVGRPDVQAFAGSMSGRHASRGVFITTSMFSTQARQWVLNNPLKIALIDGNQIAELMIDHGIGVTPEKTMDSSFFAAGLPPQAGLVPPA